MKKLTWPQVLLHLLTVYFGGDEEFTLTEVYDKTYSTLRGMYPENNAVASSVLATLQTLLDRKLIELVDGQGVYRWPAA